MDIRFCYYIDMVAQERSLSRASEKLFITQSALSQQIAKMEQELGTRLFRYHNNQMLPTEAGKVFLAGAREIITIKEQAYQKIANLSRMYTDSISIAMNRQTASLLMSHILPVFKAAYPDVKININESDTAAARQLLINGAVDLALMGKEEESHPLLDETLLYLEEIVLAISPDHPLADRYRTQDHEASTFDLHEFQNDDFILNKPGTNFRKLVDHILKDNHILPNIYCEMNNFFAVRNMVEKGLGIAFLNKSLLRETDNVIAISLNPGFLYPIVVARHKSCSLTKPMKHLIQIMKDYCNDMYPTEQ